MKPAVKYCAVYTRKSTEEGLEQDFNSLDAQREACLSYIASQKIEGWVPVKDSYDDGGYTGGNLDRPALRRLLEDIKAGKVHIIVVYKIDRLTRALMDFAKLVEVFDQHGVTFASITQSFNTTTSMGRLTLNVLLSFAQFEREVIGERVRDKIAASKKKGMWMGGNAPLGYDIQYRQLVPNTKESKTVRHIFERYLHHANVIHLKQELDRGGIVSKSRTYKDGRTVGGKSFSRGALYTLLSNPIYIGQVRHKNKTYEGMHDGIIGKDLWDAVQQKLSQQATIYKGQKFSREISLLKGLLFDEHGTPYSPSFATKGKKQYRYYISQNLIQLRDHPDSLPGRLPAHEIETNVENILRVHLSDSKKLSEVIRPTDESDVEIIQEIMNIQGSIPFDSFLEGVIERATLKPGLVEIVVSVPKLTELLSDKMRRKITIPEGSKTAIISSTYTTRRVKKGAVIIEPEKSGRDIFDLPSHQLKKLIQGFVWRGEHFAGTALKDIAAREKCSQSYVSTAIFSTFDFPKAA